jgi:hypothetical protein
MVGPIMANELQGDSRTQAAVLFEYHDRVLPAVRPADQSASVDDLHDAFVTAVLQISQKPEKFDPSRGDIVGFLVGATQRTLRDILRSRKAKRRGGDRKIVSLSVAGIDPPARDLLDEVLAKEDLLVKTEMLQLIRADVARTDEERRFLDLWENGIQDLTEYARALEIQNLPKEDQEDQVTRCRKRLTKRMERLKDRLDGEESP